MHAGHPEGQPGAAVAKHGRASELGTTKENVMSSHLVIYAVSKFTDASGQKQSRWTRIGAQFPNQKGGYSMKLELVPQDPSIDIVALPPRERGDE